MNAPGENTSDQRFDFSEDVNFLPWIGDNYGAQSRWGKPVLVVGESHYSSEEKERQFTRKCVQKRIDGSKGSFWTQTKELLVGGDDQVSHRAFWGSVAFYNYVQDLLEGPRKKPSKQMWEAAKKPFQEAVSCLKPSCIVILGVRLWKHLPKPDRNVQSKLTAKEKTTSLARYNGALAGRTYHPQSSRFSSSQWHPLVRKLMAESEAN